MKIKLILLFSLLSNILTAQWRTIAPAGTTINDITFTDRYNGYAVFQSSGIGNCTVSHGLMKTIDEGKNWVRMNTGNTSANNAVHFVNQLTGWFTGNSSDIRKTTDGGATWVQQSSGVGSGNNDIWFNDVNNGFVIGNNGILRKTTNGGGTWQTITSGVTVTLRRLFFANSSLGFVGCSNGQILRTTNGGNNWSIITTGAGGCNDIFFTDALNGYLCTGNNFYKSIDGGLSWSPIITGAINPILRIFFTNANNGYITVDGEGIYKTTDGGLTWNNTNTLNGLYDTFYAIYFTDNNTGYIGGNLGRINKTSNGGQTWKNMTSGLGTELFTVFATHRDTAYTGGKEGKIFKTENGGVTYFQQTKAFATVISKLYFLNNNVGFACSDSGRIMKTIDGGNNWILKPTNTLRGFTDISFINPNQGYVSAANGLIFKTNDGGETWDSLSTGSTEYFTAIWFQNADTGYVAGNNKILSTYNAGVTWNTHTSSIASNLKDIIFTNDSLGYCAGGFGKFLFTTDGGQNWYPTNNNSSNAAIEEMWFANDSVGYFAKQTSQSFTLDSCKVIGSASTACLANNWTMNSICMTDSGKYGYCVGGLGGTIHQTEQREIYRTYTSTDTYCAGSSVFIAYYARGFYGTGNNFTAQLSDASGSFVSPITIGTYTAVPTTYQSGIITATIPPGTPAGVNYRIRVVASNPSTIGVDFINNITIQPSFTPSVTLNNSTNGAACAGSTINFSTSSNAGGLNPTYVWTINGNNINNNSSVLSINTLQNGDMVQVSMQSNLSCASTTPVISNTFVANITTGLPLTLANDTTVCEGSNLQLNAPVGYTYNWFPNMGLNNASISNPMATINNNITYHLTITDASGCAGLDSISIISNPLPTISFLADTSVCESVCITLMPIVSGGLQNIIWSPNSSLNDSAIFNPIACPVINTVYTAVVTDNNQCTASSTIQVNVNAIPNVPQIVFDGTTLTASAANTYQWYFNGGIINGAVNINYMPQGNGDYTVMVYNAAGCNSISMPYTVNINGTRNLLQNHDLVIAPNPANDILNVWLTSTNEKIMALVLYNAAGIKVYNQAAVNNNKIVLDVKSYTAGIYHIFVQTESGVYNTKVNVIK